MADAAPQTIIDFFEGLGGTSAFARALGVGQSSASEMKRRGSIPVRYWDRLIGKPTKDGKTITLEMLHALHREVAA